MATLTIKAGQNPLVYTGASDLTLASVSWYTSTNVKTIYTPTLNNQGYTSGKPGNRFGVTVLKAPATGLVTGFIIVANQDFQINSADLGPPAVSSDSLVLPTLVAGGASQDFAFALRTAGFSFGAPVVKDASSGALVSATVSFQLNQGDFGTYAAFNAAIQALPLADIQAGKHSYTIRSVVPSGVAATVEIPTL